MVSVLRQYRLWLWTAGIVLFVSIIIGYRYDITLWDWIKLLVVPAVIAGVGLWFNAQQREGELSIAFSRAHDEALQSYLDQMAQLMLNKDDPLRESGTDSEVRSLARARTLTVLIRLDGDRKRSVLQFLYESGLVSKYRLVIDLAGADLSRIDMSGANLDRANLSKARLIDADLSGTTLREATLQVANLRFVDLRWADLRDADLRGANLSRTGRISRADSWILRTDESYKHRLDESPPTNLSGADLSNTDLSEARLDKANLSKARLIEADLRGAQLRGVDLRWADLRRANILPYDRFNPGYNRAEASHVERMKFRELRKRNDHLTLTNLAEANLQGADLSGAFLYRANLTNADLSGAKLSGANLEAVEGPTITQLAEEAETLEGATMPNGQKYEDWLKDREGDKEDADSN